MVIDSTERKRLEQARRDESRQLIFKVLDSLPEHIAVLDGEGTIIAVNLAWRAFGEANGFVGSGFGIGSNYLQVCESASGECAEEAPATAAGLRAILAGRRDEIRVEYPCHSPTEKRWFQCRISRVDTQGPTRIVVTHEDITAVRLVQETLRESEQRLRAVIEDQTELICRFQPDTTLTFVNEAYCRYFQRSQEGLLGQSFLTLIPPEHHQTIWDNLGMLNSENPIRIYEHQVLKPDGSIGWQQWSDRAICDKEGRVVEFQSVGHDITERKALEEELHRQREELAHITRVATVNLLAGALAHELNQPLAAILSNAQAAQRFLTNDEPDIDEIREIVRDIIADNKRASKVMHRLRTLLKKDAGQFETLNINHVIREILAFLRSDLVIKRLAVETELESGLPAVVGDRVQLQQVILNLITNASEAMKDVECRRIVVKTRNDDDQAIEVAVSDCGHGVSEKNLDRIFEPFFTTKEDGLGMGLAINRSIIEAHGGRLCVKNNPDQGATFYLTLPVATETRLP